MIGSVMSTPGTKSHHAAFLPYVVRAARSDSAAIRIAAPRKTPSLARNCPSSAPTHNRLSASAVRRTNLPAASIMLIPLSVRLDLATAVPAVQARHVRYQDRYPVASAP